MDLYARPMYREPGETGSHTSLLSIGNMSELPHNGFFDHGFFDQPGNLKYE